MTSYCGIQDILELLKLEALGDPLGSPDNPATVSFGLGELYQEVCLSGHCNVQGVMSPCARVYRMHSHIGFFTRYLSIAFTLVRRRR